MTKEDLYEICEEIVETLPEDVFECDSNCDKCFENACEAFKELQDKCEIFLKEC